MARRLKKDDDLGAAISLEDALSIMVVVFIIFVILFIPLINLNTMKLEMSKTSPFWSKLHSFIVENGQEENRSASKYTEFEIEGKNVKVSKNGSYTYVEAANPADSSLYVISHNTRNNKYITLRVEKFQTEGHVFHAGELEWDGYEKKWFMQNDEIDYGGNEEKSQQMRDAYQKWINDTRGIKAPARKSQPNNN